MTASDATVSALTAILVLITGHYAWQTRTRRTVEELRNARGVSVLPRLTLRLHSIATTTSSIQVMSVGPGPALAVDVEVVFVPRYADAQRICRRIQAPAMTSGEYHEVLPLMEDHDGLLHTAALAARFSHIELTGTMADVLGAAHRVFETLPDLEDWRQVRAAAQLRWTDPNAERRLAAELGKRLEPIGNTLADAIRDARM